MKINLSRPTIVLLSLGAIVLGGYYIEEYQDKQVRPLQAAASPQSTMINTINNTTVKPKATEIPSTNVMQPVIHERPSTQYTYEMLDTVPFLPEQAEKLRSVAIWKMESQREVMIHFLGEQLATEGHTDITAYVEDGSDIYYIGIVNAKSPEDIQVNVVDRVGSSLSEIEITSITGQKTTNKDENELILLHFNEEQQQWEKVLNAS